MARFILPRLASVACSALSVPRRSVCVAAEECDEPSPTTVSYLRRVIFSVTAEQAENTKYCDLIDFFDWHYFSISFLFLRHWFARALGPVPSNFLRPNPSLNPFPENSLSGWLSVCVE